MSATAITLRDKLHLFAEEISREVERNIPIRDEKDIEHAKATALVMHEIANLVGARRQNDERIAWAVYENAKLIASDQLDHKRSLDDMRSKIECVAKRIRKGTLLDPKR